MWEIRKSEVREDGMIFWACGQEGTEHVTTIRPNRASFDRGTGESAGCHAD